MRRQISLKHLVSASVLLALFVLSVTYLYSSVLNRSVTRHPAIITVSLAVTGGLFPGSGVTYRGVRIGTVDDIELARTGVTVKARLDTNRDIPADSEAVVRSLSPAGEQYLDIQPRTDGPPYLTNGKLFGRSDTATPTSVASALGNIDRLVGGIDDTQLRTMLRELAVAFDDPGDLDRLLRAAQGIIRTLDETWPATLRLLENGRTVLRTGVDKQDEFSQFAGSAHSLASWLRDYDPKLRTSLQDNPARIVELQKLLDLLTRRLPGFLDGTEGVTGIAADRDPHLRELLKVFPRGAERLSSTLYDGSLHVNLLPLPSMVCSYGREPEPPKQARRTPVYTGGRCPASFEGQQRGAAHTPPPSR